MDILSFVNSKDIREYLKNIGYEFNSLETAWIIYSCHHLSYEKKKFAWLELIDSMPDCEIPKRMNCTGWESLHNFLAQYIRIIDNEIADFNKDEPSGKYVYMYSYLYEGDERWTEDYETIYPSLSSCLDAYRADIDDLNDTYNPGQTGVLKYRIKRQSLVDVNETFEIECSSDGQLIEIICNSKRSQENSEVIDNSFDGLWFDFPTPFKKGDIVWVPTDANRIQWNCDGGFVLLGLSSWNVSDFIEESGDNSDMNGYGYFVNDNGTIYREVMYNYMDLEYYNGPYKLNEKILPALSKFIKGEIEVDFLLCVYRKVLLDVASDDIMLKSWYTKEMLEELGI